MENWQKIRECFESVRASVIAPRQGLDVPAQKKRYIGRLHPQWFIDFCIEMYPELAEVETTIDRQRRREERRNPSNSQDIMALVLESRDSKTA